MKSKRNNLTENTIIWFGKYKGNKLKDIPNEYFEYLLKSNILFKGIKNYAKSKLNL